MTSAKCAMITLSNFKWSLNVAIDEMQIFVPSFPASPGQTIATYQNNTSKHCLSNISKLQPNDRDISQHCPMLSATCCMRLATRLRRVATCWILKIELLMRMPGCNIVAQTWLNDHNIMQHPQTLYEKFDHFQIWTIDTQHVATSRNTHVGPNKVAICCAEMLRSFGRGFSPESRWRGKEVG